MKTPKTKVYFVAVATLASFAFTGIARAQTPNDSQIAEIMKTANEAEIKAAKAAKSKATDAKVKDFAEHMIKDHEQNIKDEKNITKKQDIKLKNSDTAKSLKKDADQKLSDVKKAKGAEFDKAYIDMQVAMHQDLLNHLDQTFIPNAQNADFKAYLQTTREHVQQHLAKAQEVQASLR